MSSYDAVILAGGRAPWLLPLAGTDFRSLATLKDKPLISYIMEALRKSGSVRRIYIATDSVAHTMLEQAGIAGYVPVVCENMSLPEVGLTAAAAVEAQQPGNNKILFVCDDIPLLTGEAVNSFLEQCESSPEGELYYSVVKRENCEKQFPTAVRTYGVLADGSFTGGNVTLMTYAAIVKTQEMARSLFENRKHPLKLCRLLGWRFVLRTLLRMLTSAEVEKRCSELMGVSCKAVITEYACIGMDMDKPEDWKLVHNYIDRKHDSC